VTRRRLIGAACAVALAALFSGLAQAKPARRGHASDIMAHATRRTPSAHTANLPYGGGPVLHSNRTHLIFWEPAGSGLSYDPGYESLIERFLQNVAVASHSTDNVYGLTGQYTDSHGAAAYASSYGGAVVATDRLPPNDCTEPPAIGPGWTVCLTDSQLVAEIEHVIHSEHLPTGPTDIYFLVLPNGFGSCTSSDSTSCALGGSVNGYCGYHSQSPDGALLYAVIPYNAVPGHCQSNSPRPNSSTADPAISTISHEQSEMITDPENDAWVDGSGNENGDLCRPSFGPAIGGSGTTAWNEDINGGHYYLQEEWSNVDGACEPRARPDSVSLTAAPLPRRPSTVAFGGHATAPQGRVVAYRWFFGDGASGHGRTLTHRYAHPGSYRVVLRITDSWGNWAFYAATEAVGSARAAKSG
jgi:PKD domain-containing protein